jgi:polysaccharide pyruvyl transferase WcaK-like protein
MNVKLLNVKYSPNVGDGLLVECLEQHLREMPNMQGASSVDLAGRTAYCASAVHREKMMWVLESVPGVMRPQLAHAGLKAKLAMGLRDHYRRELSGVRAVVVGGGNLLSDQDLNFPVKLAAALREAKAMDARVAIYGCGVSAHWSRAGQRMLCSALAANPPVMTAVRDAASKKAWDSLFATAAGAEAGIVHDPGVLASRVHRFAGRDAGSERPMAAIGIMSSLAIRYHGFAALESDALGEWYLSLVDAMIAKGFDICLFTNGSPEDQRFAETLWEKLAEHPYLPRIHKAAVHVPVDLCRVIHESEVVVAFRMHALIAAYSYGKPFVALKWDAKVDAFLESVGLEKCLVDVANSSAQSVADLVTSASFRTVDGERLKTTMESARRGIKELALALEGV